MATSGQLHSCVYVSLVSNYFYKCSLDSQDNQGQLPSYSARCLLLEGVKHNGTEIVTACVVKDTITQDSFTNIFFLSSGFTHVWLLIPFNFSIIIKMFTVKHYNLPFDHFWEYYKLRPSYAGKCFVLINNLLTVDAKLKPLPKHCYVYAY